MPATTLLWFDFETFGPNPRSDRPAQFACVRTDSELQEVDQPIKLYCQPSLDSLPDPQACLLTGITPQICAQQGLPEHEFANTIWQQFVQTGTLGVGYNSIQFDDEVIRFLFWRNLIDPYAREWQNHCGRWDLLNVVRCIYAFCPETLEWPKREDDLPTMKLEWLAKAQGISHELAHDALADVYATLALARLIRSRKPKLWDHCLKLTNKHQVLKEIQQETPFWHVSGMYGTEHGCIALVWPLAAHPDFKNEIIVWDLRYDPAILHTLTPSQIKEQIFASGQALNKPTRLPIKTIHTNRSPVVVRALKTLTPTLQQRWAVNLEQGLRFANYLLKNPINPDIWATVFKRPTTQPTTHAQDVVLDLYNGFVGPADRKKLEQIKVNPNLAQSMTFNDPRLMELVFLYCARGGHISLDDQKLKRWQDYCANRLGSLNDYLAVLKQLALAQPPVNKEILAALAEHAQHIFAQCLQSTL